ncbi:MAG: hypothetical protein M3114_00645, partial [Thermoproteota archaeon]|nr:hypothetical protein [Thermoproteota archaeon]
MAQVRYTLADYRCFWELELRRCSPSLFCRVARIVLKQVICLEMTQGIAHSGPHVFLFKNSSW